MTPAARIQAAIDILDRYLAGTGIEAALTRWGRASRFAGSKDRAAVRDHVHDVLRRLRSCTALGGGRTGRALMLGLLRQRDADIDALFDGLGHAPAPLDPAERAHLDNPPTLAPDVALDCPEWLAPQLQASLGAEYAPVMAALRDRAPVFLRVNLARSDRAEAIRALADDDIIAHSHVLADTALEVTANARRIRQSRAFSRGLVDLQDASSQAVIAALPDLQGRRVLDYCAGGGGKALAMAARGASVTAHDANPARMADIAPRAARAGVQIALAPRVSGQFDLVLVDAPCSGSGSWRRDPAGKWALTPRRLEELCALQSEILSQAARHVIPGGALAYVTCSLLEVENTRQIAQFRLRHPEFSPDPSRTYLPTGGGDGFFATLLTHQGG